VGKMSIQEYHDVITYTQEVVKVLKDKELTSLFEDKNYAPILIALREGPMTISELVPKYNQIVAQEVAERKLPAKERIAEIEKLERKDKTLYRYVKFLVEKGLVAEAGKRVKTGQTATETLFCRTAKIFFTADKIKDWGTDPKMKKMLPKIAKMLSLAMGIEEFSLDCFTDIMNRINKCYEVEALEVVQKHNEEIAELVKDSSFEEMDWMLDNLSTLLIIMRGAQFEKELRECCKC
jgi:hypothetical protein